jgi:hypothetical protein
MLISDFHIFILISLLVHKLTESKFVIRKFVIPNRNVSKELCLLPSTGLLSSGSGPGKSQKPPAIAAGNFNPSNELCVARIFNLWRISAPFRLAVLSSWKDFNLRGIPALGEFQPLFMSAAYKAAHSNTTVGFSTLLLQYAPCRCREINKKIIKVLHTSRCGSRMRPSFEVRSTIVPKMHLSRSPRPARIMSSLVNISSQVLAQNLFQPPPLHRFAVRQ